MTRALLFVADESVSSPIRVDLPARYLMQSGYTIGRIPLQALSSQHVTPGGAVIFQRPVHELREAFGIVRTLGAKIVVDWDDDFSAISPTHPDYKAIGPGAPGVIERIHQSLYQADMVTVSTPELARRLQPFTSAPFRVVPNGFDNENVLWKAEVERDTINIGWAGTRTHREDIRECIGAMLRVAKENPNVRLVIGWDAEIYKLLAKIPERQKLYLPGAQYGDYPYILGHFDILCAPLKDTTFNRVKSDIKLVDAGARGIPFVCSDVLPYQSWPHGTGFLCHDETGWYAALNRLVSDAELRREMGENGRRASDNRLADLANIWRGITEEL